MMSWNCWQLKAVSPRIIFNNIESLTLGWGSLWAWLFAYVCSCMGMWKVLLYPLFYLSNYLHLFIPSASFLCAGHWAQYWGYKDERQRFLSSRSSLCSEGEKEVNTRTYAIRQISQGAVGTQMKITKARLGGSGAGESDRVWKQEKLLCKVLITPSCLQHPKADFLNHPRV